MGAMVAGKRILVVASESGVQEQVRRALEPHGAHIVAAATASEASERVAAEAWDLFVARYVLPDAEGKVVVRVLKPNDHAAHTPIIMLHTKQDRGFVTVRGVDCYCPIPIDAVWLVIFAGRILASLGQEDLGDGQGCFKFGVCSGTPTPLRSACRARFSAREAPDQLAHYGSGNSASRALKRALHARRGAPGRGAIGDVVNLSQPWTNGSLWLLRYAIRSKPGAKRGTGWCIGTPRRSRRSHLVITVSRA